MNRLSACVLAAAVGVPILLAGLYPVSMRSADSGCVAVAEQRGYPGGISYEWSWWPLGTTCTFDNRVSETRLLW